MVITPKSRNNRYRRRSSGTLARRKLRADITRISTLAERVCLENLHRRIEMPSGDAAIRQLTDTINDMIERLNRAVRKQSVFITDASHEMRTPIAVIKGYADLIDRWGKRDPQVLQESINAIQAEAERMNSLIKSLLLLANGDDTGEPHDKRPMSLNAVSGEAIREAVMLHGCDAIELIERTRETVYADYDMILQLIRVFLDNAVKYAKNKNDPIQIIISGDEHNSYLTVRDYGIGIGEDDLPYIFERFYRADKSRSKKIPGFGLGLAVADMIARAHHATLCVHSEQGAGTEFTVSFRRNGGLDD